MALFNKESESHRLSAPRKGFVSRCRANWDSLFTNPFEYIIEVRYFYCQDQEKLIELKYEVWNQNCIWATQKYAKMKRSNKGTRGKSQEDRIWHIMLSSKAGIFNLSTKYFDVWLCLENKNNAFWLAYIDLVSSMQLGENLLCPLSTLMTVLKYQTVWYLRTVIKVNNETVGKL